MKIHLRYLSVRMTCSFTSHSISFNLSKELQHDLKIIRIQLLSVSLVFIQIQTDYYKYTLNNHKAQEAFKRAEQIHPFLFLR